MSYPVEYQQQRPPVPAPGRVGQGTAVEQTRAAAEVLAAVQVAQQCPRNIALAVSQMQESCAQMGLAERAFYSFPRAGGTVSGASIHLARELARIWGNLDYGIAELRRDDDYHQSEMRAYAWDQQTNTRNSSTFIVPHKRDTRQGVTVLTDMRDIYENNANNGARRVREAIFALLPPWFVDEAKGICAKTLEKGPAGMRLDQRISVMLDTYSRIGVTVAQLEEKAGAPQGKWTGREVAALGVVWKSIERGEITKDEAFPQERVTLGEVTGQPVPKPSAAAAPTARGEALPVQTETIDGLFDRYGIDDPVERADIAARIVGAPADRPLTADEAARVIGTLQGIRGPFTEWLNRLFAVPSDGES